MYVRVVYNCEYSELETSLILSSAGVPDLRSAVVLEFQRDLNFPVSVSWAAVMAVRRGTEA